MTREEYAKKRDVLMNEVQSLINNGKIDEANAKMAEIESLDAEFEAVAEANANFHALYDDPRVPEVARRMFSGGVMDLETGRYWAGNTRVSDPLYLSASRSMVDVAKSAGNVSGVLLDSNALGDTVRGMVTGKWSNPELKNLVTTSTTGTIIPTVLSAQVIDLARSLSLFTTAGVPTIPMDTNNMTISRISEDPVFGFKAEGEEGEELSFGIDGVKLESKTVYGYAYISIEAVESSQNLNAIMMRVFASAVAQAIDNGMLYGESDADGNAVDYAPEGVMNDSNILTLEATNSGYDDFVKGAAAIKQNNYVPTAWAVNAYTDETLSLLKDSEGRYLAAPEALSNLQKVVSNQLAYDAEDGSDGLVFDPAAMLIGIQNDVRIKMIEDEKCLKNGLVGFQVYAMLDCKVVSPKAICRITGLGASEAEA